MSTFVSKQLHVLLAEDNPADVLLMREALSSRFEDVELSVQQNGEQMMKLIDEMDRGNTPCPDVILLDLNLPRVTGEDILWRLGQSPTCQNVPKVVVTSSDSPRDRETTARLGVSHYFRKPTDYDEFMRLGDLVVTVLAERESES
jgi:CheY-like chemotaxis protein